MKEVQMDLILVDEHNKSLKTRCDIIDFDNLDISISDISRKMYNVMVDNNGIGLAAPQVGLLKRFFIMFIDGEFFTCINPEIIVEGLEYNVAKEGCLSFPKLYLNIKRPTEISVKYYDADGKRIVRDMKGLMARAFSHELDHLDGVTFDSHASKLGLKMAKEKRIKKQKKLFRNKSIF